METLERIGFGSDHALEIFGRLAKGLFEQREEQLVLAVEVLVEASQRLLRLIEDLLDGEVGRPLLVDQRERGIQESLDALLGARPGRVQAAGNRPPAPGRHVRVIGSFVRHSWNPLYQERTVSGPSRENVSSGHTFTRRCRRGRPSSRSARPASS